MAIVQGVVSYQGKPLQFGTVLFQPAVGSPSMAFIQPDGSFQMTIGKQKGAIVGKNYVAIRCYEGQSPDHKKPGPIDDDSDKGLGKPLIPEKYLQPETSGIVVEVKTENEPFQFDLK